MTIKASILNEVTDFYLQSADFNGLPIRQLNLTRRGVKPALKALVREEEVSINFGDRHPNPHIQAFAPEPANEQLVKLGTVDLTHACVYPLPAHLLNVVKPSDYEGRPFNLKLARGEPQLKFLPFDLKVLEAYRNDPRYYYENDDIQGSISVKDDYYESKELRESDQVVLQTFGFAYSDDMQRAVAVFLRYLADLSPEHQQIWNAHLLTDKYRLHPDYYRSTILGEWYEGVSIFEALIEELHHINQMSSLMGRAPMFRKSYHEDRPKHFGFLIRPTQREFNDFVHLLDKLLSENINRKFFERDNLAFSVNNPGTILMLETWIEAKVRFKDPAPKDEMLATLKEVRRLRQRPAHAVQEDKFDQLYFQEQRELVQEAYEAVRTIRLILGLHPAAKNYKVPDWLDSGVIRTY